ncbi:MAG: hypothetical protein JSW39_04115 [Desulfobacterales bacterium]|nr:MAG: hypothetical protein JSW39_04115 [Desulfobacterales bacterium]
MPIYEYECERCGRRLERFQKTTAEPAPKCGDCNAPMRRCLSSGVGVIRGGVAARSRPPSPDACSMENTGQTCCGRPERCDVPPCRA